MQHYRLEYYEESLRCTLLKELDVKSLSDICIIKNTVHFQYRDSVRAAAYTPL